MWVINVTIYQNHNNVYFFITGYARKRSKKERLVRGRKHEGLLRRAGARTGKRVAVEDGDVEVASAMIGVMTGAMTGAVLSVAEVVLGVRLPRLKVAVAGGIG